MQNQDINIAGYEMPRLELREAAFRKYEHFISQVIKNGTVIVDPFDFPGRMKPGTFICRFNDAKLAFRKFKYRSDLIPESFDLSTIRAVEMSTGAVKLTIKQDKVEGFNAILSNEHEKIERLVGQLNTGELEGPIEVVLIGDAQADIVWLESLKGKYFNFDFTDPERGRIQLL